MTRLKKTLAAVFATASLGSLGSVLFTLHENQGTLQADNIQTNFYTEQIWSQKPCTPECYAAFQKSGADYRNMDTILIAEAASFAAFGAATYTTLTRPDKQSPKLH